MSDNKQETPVAKKSGVKIREGLTALAKHPIWAKAKELAFKALAQIMPVTIRATDGLRSKTKDVLAKNATLGGLTDLFVLFAVYMAGVEVFRFVFDPYFTLENLAVSAAPILLFGAVALYKKVLSRKAASGK
jgi:hypothetical protein